MDGNSKPEEEGPQDNAPREEPEIYTLKKDLKGWQYNRRAFLRAAGATAAAAAVGSLAGCDVGGSQTPQVQTVVVTSAAQSGPPAGAAPSDTPVGEAAPTKTMASEAPPTETMVSEAPPTQTLIPTYTSEPEETPTPADTSTPTPSATPDTPQAKFLKDITIPDGTVMEPGQAFTKTWRFQNIGSVPWGEGIKIVFVPGKQKGFESKQMGGPDWAPVANVAPGKNVDISVDLAAPKQLGHHRSYWRLQLANGDWLETIHYADIYVASKEPLDPGEKGTEFKVKIEGKWVTWTQPCGSPLPPGATCVCDCVTAPLPGKAGEVPPGENGGTITGPGGETRWLPCGSEIPPGWTCTCNCVSVPAACTCDQVCTCDTVCSCVGHTVCTCDQIHYWYPN